MWFYWEISGFEGLDRVRAPQDGRCDAPDSLLMAFDSLRLAADSVQVAIFAQHKRFDSLLHAFDSM
jgi:hypothetical protein